MNKKYKIGYTTGVFDMFHVGHLAILEKAKAQCEYLIVGVSTDLLVENYKHKKPIVRQAERMRIVSAIKYVDQVVSQDDLDKFKAWECLHYDVLFHGDDWKSSELYNDIEKRLNSVGVDVVYLPHTPGISTTILTEVIRSERGGLVL